MLEVTSKQELDDLHQKMKKLRDEASCQARSDEHQGKGIKGNFIKVEGVVNYLTAGSKEMVQKALQKHAHTHSQKNVRKHLYAQ